MKLTPLVLLLISLTAAQSAAGAQAILAGGCFWCVESDFEALEGVTDVVSGFTGGTAANPTYSGNHRGHYEAVRITYDPAVIDYQGILDHYWVNIDPFDDRGQFCDKGPSYRAAIFVSTPEELRLAERSRAQVQAEFPEQKVVTEILPATRFFPIKGAEAYHQDYYRKFPFRYKTYRWSCGRDRRLQEIWGDRATH
ncbi:MAG: peptide-methionine (S)-S-oxide reductase MsrA [Pseudomonadota bacterium]